MVGTISSSSPTVFAVIGMDKLARSSLSFSNVVAVSFSSITGAGDGVGAGM